MIPPPLISFGTDPRRYKLAEKLSDRLDEMSKDLTAMMDEINSASSNLSKTNKNDDPVGVLSKSVELLLIVP